MKIRTVRAKRPHGKMTEKIFGAFGAKKGEKIFGAFGARVVVYFRVSKTIFRRKKVRKFFSVVGKGPRKNLSAPSAPIFL